MMTVPEMITFASEYFDNFNSLNYYTSRNIAPDGAVDGYEKTWYNEFINVSLIRPPYSVQLQNLAPGYKVKFKRFLNRKSIS